MLCPACKAKGEVSKVSLNGVKRFKGPDEFTASCSRGHSWSVDRNSPTHLRGRRPDSVLIDDPIFANDCEYAKESE